ncbi:YhcN/YlaJ family sporulation lipoprotein [Paenibacillus sp. y28]|uniref:YhcN/YlaJ family sporulation lipoprotein n=1 Tax=Paenibacillus sp. y28 TaxID=3129110 RepID=UPI003018C7D7
MNQSRKGRMHMRLRILWTTGISCLLLAGCMNQQKETAPSQESTGQAGQIRVQQTAPEKKQIENRQEVADHLEKLAESNPSVKKATCVVIGNTAIVGLDVDESLERARVDVIKYSVAEALRKDPYGVNAFVTADLDLNARIARIRDDVRHGRPMAGIAEQLAELIGRIVPQIPRDIRPEQPEPSKAENEGQFQSNNL